MWSGISLVDEVRPSFVSVAISMISNCVFWNWRAAGEGGRSLGYYIMRGCPAFSAPESF